MRCLSAEAPPSRIRVRSTAFTAAVDEFYRRMLSDDRVAHFFDDVDMEGQIAKQKLPRPTDYTTEIPRDPNGKLYKRRLKDPYWEGREGNII